MKQEILDEIINSKPINCLYAQCPNEVVDGFKEALKPILSQSLDTYAMEFLKELTDEERLEVFNKFCKSCGSKDNKCQCWNED